MSRTAARLLLGVATVFIGTVAALGLAPMNLDTLKTQIMRYHDSGEYMQEIAAIDTQAEQYLDSRANTAKGALVLDIDETALSNWSFMRSVDFGWVDALFDQYCHRHGAAVIEPTRRLAEHALRLHLALFFITARREAARDDTVADLTEVGYHGWTTLYCRPQADKDPSVAPYKTSVRQSIQALGWHIVANVGDQDSDLRGGFADRTFKLPNPMYFVR